MADEINMVLRANVTNGNYQESFVGQNTVFNQAAVGSASGVLSIGITAESLFVGDVATVGFLFLQNLDSTNFVTFGPDSSGQVTVGKIKAGEVAGFRLNPGVTLKLTADTAPCKVRFLLLED